MKTPKLMITMCVFLVTLLVCGIALANDSGIFDSVSSDSSLAAPTLTVSTAGTTLSLSWTSVAGATGYTLFYAPAPYTGPDTIGSIPMGTQTAMSASLWEGAAFYLAVQAYSNDENSELSNIESFSIDLKNTQFGWRSKYTLIHSDDLEQPGSGVSPGLILSEYGTQIVTQQPISGQSSVRLYQYGTITTDPDIISMLPNTAYIFEFDYKIIDPGANDVVLYIFFQPKGTTDDNLTISPQHYLLKNAEATGTFSSGALTGSEQVYYLNISAQEHASIVIDNINIYRVVTEKIFEQPDEWKLLNWTPYPRLGNFFMATTSGIVQSGGAGGLPYLYTAEEVENKLAFSDVVAGLPKSIQTVDPDFPRRMKKKNPNMIFLPDIMSWELTQYDWPPSDATTDLGYEYVMGVKEDWIALDTKGERIESTSWAPYPIMNMSKFCPFVDGQDWIDYQVDFVTNRMMGSGLWDGVFFDNLLGRVHPFIPNYDNPDLFDFDLNLNGVRDETIAWTNYVTRNAAINMLTDIRDRVGNLEIIMGNSGANPQIFLSPYVNGYIFEGWSSAWSYMTDIPSEAGWRNAIEEYFYMHQNSVSPNIEIIQGEGEEEGGFDPTTVHYEPTTKDFLKHRFLMGSALLGDGFYEYDLCFNKSAPYWFDEFSVNAQGVAIEDPQYKGYLGQALGNAIELKSAATVIIDENFDSGALPDSLFPSQGVSVSTDPAEVISGRGSLLLYNPDHTKTASTIVGTNQSHVPFVIGSTYFIEFDWIILETLDSSPYINVWSMDYNSGGETLNGMVSGDHGQTHFPITIDSGNDHVFLINMSNGGGKMAIDNLRISKGGVGPWRRDFENGFVLVNPLKTAHTFTASELAGTLKRTNIKRILGTQNPTVNNGQPVTGSLTLQPFDAIILLADQILLPSNLEVTLKTHDFGTCAMSTTSSKAFTVRNISNSPVKITNLMVPGLDTDQFMISNDTCNNSTLNPSQTCTIEATFSPKSKGTKSAQIAVTTSTPNTSIRKITLSGKAFQSPLIYVNKADGKCRKKSPISCGYLPGGQAARDGSLPMLYFRQAISIPQNNTSGTEPLRGMLPKTTHHILPIFLSNYNLLIQAKIIYNTSQVTFLFLINFFTKGGIIMSTELRTQFLNYMTLQRFAPSTKKNYVMAVYGLAKFHNQAPDTLTNDQIQDYLRHLLEDRGLSWGTCNNYFSGILCFYRNICKWDETQFNIPPRPRIKKLPTVFSMEEVKRLFAATTNLKHLALLETAYSAGLRLSEIVHLKPHHIESDPSRMTIRVEQGKGKKDRYTILSKHLLVDLKAYWRKYRPDKWLFPGREAENHLSRSAAHMIYVNAKKKPA